MTFTNDIATQIGQVRFEIGDNVENQGARANTTNLSDEEIQYMLDLEGSVGCAAARACEMLASDWTKVADIGAGTAKEQLATVAEMWRKQAQYLRGIYGFGAEESESNFNFQPLRRDGYSDAAGGVVTPDGDVI